MSGARAMDGLHPPKWLPNNKGKKVSLHWLHSLTTTKHLFHNPPPPTHKSLSHEFPPKTREVVENSTRVWVVINIENFAIMCALHTT